MFVVSSCVFFPGQASPIKSCLWVRKVPHLGKALVFLTNIRLGWKGSLGENTLAYYKNWLQIGLKSVSRFIYCYGKCHCVMPSVFAPF